MSTEISETAQIIQFAAIRPKFGKPKRKVRHPDNSFAQRLGTESEPSDIQENVSETGKNFRLRKQRRDRWLEADALREYWKAAQKMDSAIHRVQQHELPEGDLHKPLAPGSCWPILAKYRAAIMAQLLTPAPTAREIEWKRAVFKAGDHEHTDVKPERIERAIAEDVELLRTHPTRRSLGSNSDA